MTNFDVVILAAGKGTRMKDNLVKPLHKVAGLTMFEHVLAAAKKLKPNNIIAVQSNEVDYSKFGVKTAIQSQQKGSAHALLAAMPQVTSERVLVLNADMPMITSSTIEQLLINNEALLAGNLENPYGYGRVFALDGKVNRIVEEKDATPKERRTSLVNAGVYLFNTQRIKEQLKNVQNSNSQGEYYLTDATKNLSVVTVQDSNEILGANDQIQLSHLAKLMRQRINNNIMLSGVTMIDPQTTYIDADVIIEPGTAILPNTVIEGPSKIGHNSIIGPNAHIRPNTQLSNNVHIGNFVEVKNSTIGPYSQVGHLSYVGDATIGAGTNIGAGTIFVNYDGKNKNHTNVGDRVFIGSNSKLIAPINISDEAITAAGSTIVQDIPKHAMGIARARQENKLNFWDRMEHEDFTKKD
ncbi:MAG: NTP transferase domain-containing protein [Lactobacillaceae bacterium]|jgi:bifunctional UDP-N-acetylglucosamine pyrophosphorylase/glucosamine-1-phosphate N-acetyltransferase|nr:NTP transferase domain-containing protein [Lactobacillaceae bacterium]